MWWVRCTSTCFLTQPEVLVTHLMLVGKSKIHGSIGWLLQICDDYKNTFEMGKLAHVDRLILTGRTFEHCYDYFQKNS